MTFSPYVANVAQSRFVRPVLNAPAAHLRLGLTSDFTLTASSFVDIDWSSVISSDNWSFTPTTDVITVPASGVSLVMMTIHTLASSLTTQRDIGIQVKKNTVVVRDQRTENSFHGTQNSRFGMSVAGSDDLEVSVLTSAAMDLDSTQTFLDILGYA